MLIGLLNADDIHDATWEVDIGANLAVDLDETLHKDLLDLLLGEGILEPVAQHKDEGEALPKLVGAS